MLFLKLAPNTWDRLQEMSATKRYEVILIFNSYSTHTYLTFISMFKTKHKKALKKPHPHLQSHKKLTEELNKGHHTVGRKSGAQEQ